MRAPSTDTTTLPRWSGSTEPTGPPMDSQSLAKVASAPEWSTGRELKPGRRLQDLTAPDVAGTASKAGKHQGGRVGKNYSTSITRWGCQRARLESLAKDPASHKVRRRPGNSRPLATCKSSQIHVAEGAVHLAKEFPRQVL